MIETVYILHKTGVVNGDFEHPVRLKTRWKEDHVVICMNIDICGWTDKVTHTTLCGNMSLNPELLQGLQAFSLMLLSDTGKIGLIHHGGLVLCVNEL